MSIDGAPAPARPRRSLRASDRVYETLREEIVTWRLEPGTLLSEVDHSERLGVSRTPLREALRRLVADGLAVPGKGRTLVVSDLSADDVRHLFELREALEPQAARLAARRGEPRVFAELRERFDQASALLTDSDPDHLAYYELVADFDRATDEAMDSSYLRHAIDQVRAHALRARRMSRSNTTRLAQAAREHAVIAEAIADGDELLAQQATAVHLRASYKNILATLTAPHHRAPGSGDNGVLGDDPAAS